MEPEKLRQGLLSDNTRRDVLAAVLLVNGLTGRQARGRPQLPPGREEIQDVTRAALAVATYEPRVLDPATMRRIVRLASDLRAVFEAIDDPPGPAAPELINAMLLSYGVHLHLTSHDDRRWHLHYHRGNADADEVLGSGCAVALANVIDAGESHRLGICDAVMCDQVLFDVSKNSSRRFCGFPCRNRTKTSEYRRRHQGPA